MVPSRAAQRRMRAMRTSLVNAVVIALLAAAPSGTHRIVFRYRGWQDYPLLFAIGAASLVVLVYTDIRRARARGIARRH